MKSEQFDFAVNLKELEDITAWFESEEVDLNQALVKFERGMKLAADLKNHLGEVENRVEKIKQRFDAVPAIATEDPDTQPAPADDPTLGGLFREE